MEIGWPKANISAKREKGERENNDSGQKEKGREEQCRRGEITHTRREVKRNMHMTGGRKSLLGSCQVSALIVVFSFLLKPYKRRSHTQREPRPLRRLSRPLRR